LKKGGKQGHKLALQLPPESSNMNTLDVKIGLPLVTNNTHLVGTEDADLELLQKELDKVTSFTYELPWSREQTKSFKGIATTYQQLNTEMHT
jgi:hypothetical protein